MSLIISAHLLLISSWSLSFSLLALEYVSQIYFDRFLTLAVNFIFPEVLIWSYNASSSHTYLINKFIVASSYVSSEYDTLKSGSAGTCLGVVSEISVIVKSWVSFVCFVVNGCFERSFCFFLDANRSLKLYCYVSTSTLISFAILLYSYWISVIIVLSISYLFFISNSSLNFGLANSVVTRVSSLSSTSITDLVSSVFDSLAILF